MRKLPARLCILALVLVASLAGGCTTVSDFAGLPHAGHQPGGSYVPLASEQQLNCRGLSDQVELGLKDMQNARANMKTEREALPSTLVSAYGRMFGGADGGLKNATQYRESEARVRALNQQLAAKGCHFVDVDARIMAFDLAPMNVAKKDNPDQLAAKPAVAAAKMPTQKPAASGLEVDIEALTSVMPAALKY